MRQLYLTNTLSRKEFGFYIIIIKAILLSALVMLTGVRTFASSTSSGDDDKRVVRSVMISVDYPSDSTGGGHSIRPLVVGGVSGGSSSQSSYEGIVLGVDTTASVGSIPLEGTVSPTGAQVYSIAIPTVEDIRFRPNLSLVYNSQGGQGIAGWGWNIGGLSSITLSNRNMFYHGEVSPADVSDTSAVWRLDGSLLIPCTEEAFVQAGYQLQSETGRVMVQVHRLSDGRVSHFTTKSPDGGSAVYGWSDGSRPNLVNYPVTRQTDRFGNVITYTHRATHHSVTDNDTYSLLSVDYGGYEGMTQGTGTARIAFEYSAEPRADVTPVYFAGTDLSETALLKGIASVSVTGDTLWLYSLHHTTGDCGDSLLSSVTLSNGDGQNFNPARFYYGDGSSSSSSLSLLPRRTVLNSFADYPEAADPDDPDSEPYVPEVHDPRDYVFMRGKFTKDSYDDGILFFRNSTTTPSSNHYSHYYSPLCFAPCVDSLPSAREYSFLDRYCHVQPVDIDSDGVDEIVQLSFGSRTQSGNSYYMPLNIRVLGYDSDAGGLTQLRGWTRRAGGYRYVGGAPYVMPHCFWFGDFVGNGTVQMLRMNQTRGSADGPLLASNHVILTDLMTGEEIYDTYEFLNDYWYPERVIVQDVDGDGRTEWCYAQSDSLRIYHYRNAPVPPDPEEEPLDPDDPEYEEPETEYAWQLALDKTVALPTSAFSIRTIVGDFNCDGLVDILSPSQYGSAWTMYSFDGEEFHSETTNVSQYLSGDEYIQMDVNHDNLPDLVRKRDGSLSALINERGQFSSGRIYDSVMALSDSTALLPANTVRFREVDDCIVFDRDTAKLYRFTRNRGAERLLTAVSDGLGTLTTHSYSDLTADWAYTTDEARALSADSLYHKRRLLLMAVDSTSVCAWTPGKGNLIPAGDTTGVADLTLLSSTSYRYTDAVVGSRGLGFCGFGAVTTVDNIPDGGFLDVQTSTFDPELSGVPAGQTSSKQSVSSGALSAYSSTVNSYTNSPVSTDARFNPLLTGSVHTDHLTGMITTTVQEYDSYDSPTLTLTTHSVSGTSALATPTCLTPTDSVRTEYLHRVSTGTYLLSLPVRTVSSSSYTDSLLSSYDGTVIVRDSTAISYDSSTLLPVSSVSRRQSRRYRLLPEEEPGWTIVQSSSPGNELQGTVIEVSQTNVQSGGGYSVQVNPRDSLPEFPGIDPLHPGIDTTTTLYLLAMAEDDVLLGERRWTYDARGNVLTDTSCGPDGVTFTGDSYTYDSSGRHVVTHTDALGRTETEDGVARSRTVDARGRLARADDAGGHILYFYTGGDLLRRICVRVAGTAQYTGSDDLPPLNKYTKTVFCYDAWGERISMDDPCAGVQTDTTAYNSDGSRTLTSISDRGTTVTQVDRYGRTLSEVRTPAVANAATVPVETRTYVYDANTSALAQLGLSAQAGDGSLLIYESVTSALPGSPSSSTTTSSKHYTYDSLDRLTSVKETAPGGRWFRQGYTYSQGGSVLSATSFTEGADANDLNGTALGTESYSYANGHQTRVDFARAVAAGTTPTASDTVVVWQLTAENDFGQPTGGVSGPLTRTYAYDQYGMPTGRSIAPSASPGSPLQSYTYAFDHSTGNLTGRADAVHSTGESFTYDSLNRLTGSSFTINGGAGGSGGNGSTANPVTGTVSYQNFTGNLLGKSSQATLDYADSLAHPYTLTSAQDLELNAEHYPSNMDIVYNTSWRPRTISRTGVKATLDYGVDGERIRMGVRDSTNTSVYEVGTYGGTIKYYLGGGRYEHEESTVHTDSSSVVRTTSRLFLGGDAYSAPAVYCDAISVTQRTVTTINEIEVYDDNGQLVEIELEEEDALVEESDTTAAVFFIGRDYQGSITELVGEDGALVQSYSYDPWGRPRDAQTLEQYRCDGTSSSGGSAPAFLLGRGYTGHEWLPWFALYNCNARLYDPLLGRFLEPDPYVQAPDFTQNFNRFAYCLNNPMKYSDDSGENPVVIAAIVVGVISGTTNLLVNIDNCEGAWEYISAFAVGAISGIAAVATTIATGGGAGAVWAAMATGAAGGASTAAINSVIAQTGKNFDGIENIDTDLLWAQVSSSAVAGLAGGAAGYWASNSSMLVNNINSPILRSMAVAPIAATAGHIAGGTSYGLFQGMDFYSAYKASFNGLGRSVLIATALSVASTTGVSLANGINPVNGRQFEPKEDYKEDYNEWITAEDLGLEAEVERIRKGEVYNAYPHDGTPHNNNRNYLPSGVTYKEYVVPTPGISGPGPARIVVSSDNNWYYTPDHYHTFLKFKP